MRFDIAARESRTNGAFRCSALIFGAIRARLRAMPGRVAPGLPLRAHGSSPRMDLQRARTSRAKKIRRDS